MAIQVAHSHSHVHPLAPVQTSVHRRAVRHARARAEHAHLKAIRAPPRLLFKLGGAPATSSTSSSAPITTAQLPRKLSRLTPSSLQLDASQSESRLREALGRMYPELVELPREFVRVAYVQKNSSKLMQSCASAKPLVERRTGLGVPKRIPVASPSPSADASLLPTHFLAISSSPAASLSKRPIADRTITLYPVHALTLLTTCSAARLPYLPSSPQESGTRSLPAVPLALPHPRSFPTLLSYLYTLSPRILLQSLLPLAPAQLAACGFPAGVTVLSGVLARNPVDCRTYAGYVAEALDAGALLAQALLVHGVWENACVLGVDFDAQPEEGLSFGEAMELAWEVLIGAIALQNARAQRAQ